MSEPPLAALRQLPSVDSLLRVPELQELRARDGHEALVAALRATLEETRSDVRLGGAPPPSPEALVARVTSRLERTRLRALQPVLNATGVVLHTNLGRAPLAAAARAAQEAVAGSCNLELSLETGRRGPRGGGIDALLRRLTGAEASVVVNNNAAALLLALTALCAGREVIVSRGQQVEIGGGFRIPDVLRQSGACLVEVGTTNRTYASDYADAIGERTAAVLVVHRSNFRLEGFVHEPSLAVLGALCRERGVLLIDDAGSGALRDVRPLGLPGEPIVPERISAGADVVCFSGDKLLGGPQAGILIGAQAPLESCRRHPLMRALRSDKSTLAALEATLSIWDRREEATGLPVWRALTASASSLRDRAERWRRSLEGRCGGVELEVRDSHSTVGGGSVPGGVLPGHVLAIGGPSVAAVSERLRAGRPALLGRLEEGCLLLDPRTLAPEDDDAVLAALEAALATSGAAKGGGPRASGGGEATGSR